MTVGNLYRSVTGCTGVKSVEVREAYGQATVNVEIVTSAHTLSIGDSVTVDIGYDLAHSVMLTGGIVRKIITRVPEFDYVITIQDKLCRAIDAAIVSDDPLVPYKASNIKAEDLLVYLLSTYAGISGVVAASTVFTFGTVQPVPLNMVTVWSMIELINRISGYTTYCDAAGTVRFVNRPGYITASDTVASHNYTVGASGDILAVEYDRNTEQLINKVVVYGGVGNQIHATASAVSAYLPSGFYKTMVLAHPLLDNITNAQATADLNLTIFNRLTETISLSVVGTSSVRCRDVVSVTEPFSGLAGNLWLVIGATHTLSESGFSQQLTLVR